MGRKKFKKAFTLIELIIVFVIIGLIVSIITFSFNNINKAQVLDKGTLNILSFLDEARYSAMSSKEFIDYGVHFDTNSATFFKESYVENNASNKKYILNNNLIISDILISGGSDVIFKKITGKTDNNGSIKISILNDQDDSNIINIYTTGLVEKQ
ncbi:MAG: type II secretion system protein [Candidatus Taylorbacteria bacterium]|nr:type II secretion system protein [Candidatus Taylorbacteria bacterium]